MSRFMRTAAILSFCRSNFSLPVRLRWYNDDIHSEAYRPLLWRMRENGARVFIELWAGASLAPNTFGRI